MKIVSGFLILSIAVTPALASKKPAQDCLVHFAVVYVDRLNNTDRGLQGKQLKGVEDKLKNYGDICYTAEEAGSDMVFFIHTKPAVYHGVLTTSDTSRHTDSNPVSGTIRDEDGNRSTISGTVETTATTTTTSSVPYEVDYSVFILNIMIHDKEAPPDKFVILRTFDQKGLYRTIYGIGYGKGKNPIVNVIDVAAKWMHENKSVWVKSR